MDPDLVSMTSYGLPVLLSMTSLGLPDLISMTSLGLPDLVSVTIGTRILKKKSKKSAENDFFENFHHVYCDPEVFLHHICRDVSWV